MLEIDHYWTSLVQDNAQATIREMRALLEQQQETIGLLKTQLAQPAPTPSDAPRQAVSEGFV